MMKSTLKPDQKLLKGNYITKFTDNEIPKENTHYSCVAAIWVDFVIKLEKENYPQVNLEQCKSVLKKRKTLTYLMMNQEIQVMNLKLKLNKFNDLCFLRILFNVSKFFTHT